jgi:hypothetical protein
MRTWHHSSYPCLTRILRVVTLQQFDSWGGRVSKSQNTFQRQVCFVKPGWKVHQSTKPEQQPHSITCKRRMV